MEKSDKEKVESLRESISRTETNITMAIAEGNKRAENAARKLLEGLQKRLKDLKAK